MIATPMFQWPGLSASTSSPMQDAADATVDLTTRTIGVVSEIGFSGPILQLDGTCRSRRFQTQARLFQGLPIFIFRPILSLNVGSGPHE